VKAFFKKLRKLTENTFQIEPLSAVPFGDEFVVTHANLKLTMETKKIETNAILVWRLHKDRIFEAWDIPAVLTLPQPQSVGSHKT
jgi:hypothetical protein